MMKQSLTFASSPFWPIAIGFFGLGTGYFIWGRQALFGYPKNGPKVDRTMGLWLHLALVRSWEIDGISQGLSYFWAPNTARYKGSPSGRNLSGIILESNFTDVNFSSANLESAMFWGATVTNTDFSGISKFKNSQWQHTNWWNANKMSCDLVRYLMREYPPNNSDDVSTSQSLSARSCSGSGKTSAN